MSDTQLFQLFGLAYLAIGVGALLDIKNWQRVFEDFTKNRPLLLIGGVGSLVVGFLLVAFHNTWAWEWPVIITIIGWLALIKGILLLALPQVMIILVAAMSIEKNLLKIHAAVTMVLGLLLLALGIWIV